MKTKKRIIVRMLTTETKEIITHMVSWDEISVLISQYVLEKYEIGIPESAQVRVLDKNNTMVNPVNLRIKYEKDVEGK
jgi:hypothetical protein